MEFKPVKRIVGKGLVRGTWGKRHPWVKIEFADGTTINALLSTLAFSGVHFEQRLKQNLQKGRI